MEIVEEYIGVWKNNLGAIERMSMLKKRFSVRWTMVLLVTSFGSSILASSVLPPSKPNVIFILADDLGIGDLQCYGNPYIETPNINRLAKEGIRFTDYYSPSPLCAPARAAILTGRYNHRTGAVDVSSNRGIDRIALSEKTMGDYFQYVGYKTALIGKWHNGLYSEPYLPHNRGFDLFYGFPNGGQDYYAWNMMRNGKYESSDGRYSTDVLTEEAVGFIEENRESPFFLFLSHHAPHSPFQAPDSLIRKYVDRLDGKYSKDVAVLYAMIEVMDRGVGKILDRLEELGLRENTMIVFTSDNGAVYIDKSNPRYHGQFSGEKGNVLEQGIRVPAIVSWKGIIDEGRISNEPFFGCDWLPTFYSFVDRELPSDAKPLDGRNIASAFTLDEDLTLEGRALFFQKNRYTPVGHSDGSVRLGKWKLFWPMVPVTMQKEGVRDNASYYKGITEPHWEMPIDMEIPKHHLSTKLAPQLFDLDLDPSERKDLSDIHPEIVAEMRLKYDNWFEDIMGDWDKSWKEIRSQDALYWNERVVPDPRSIYDGYWEWGKVDQDLLSTDPLQVFKGYWSKGN